jgi:DNA-binding NarL/FixJ family response regulator
MQKSYPSSGAKRAESEAAAPLIRVLLFDPHSLVRAGMRALLERVPEIEVAEAANRQQTLSAIKEYRPDLVLLDVPLAGVAGLGLLREIREKYPTVRTIVVAQHPNEGLAVQALRLGAFGFLTKGDAGTELEVAIKTVARGERYLAAALSRQSILTYLSDPNSFSSRLTARQHEVLQLIAEGHATKEIARRLNISVKTVESHRSQIMERLNIHDIAGLVRYALRLGLVKFE